MANFAHIENNQVTGVYDTYPNNWRNISNFNILAQENQEFIYDLGWRNIVKVDPEYNTETQSLGGFYYVVDNDNVQELRQIFDKPVVAVQVTEPNNVEPTVTATNITLDYNNTEQLHNEAMMLLREKRDRLLRESDYTQLYDVMERNGPELTQQFIEYRQLLRDLPITYENDMSFIDESTVTYPQIPGVV